MERTNEYDPLIEEWVCRNNGLTMEECQCLSCFPRIHRFKWICAECKTIDDVIDTLTGYAEYFRQLKGEGWTIGGPVEDDYMELYPPDRPGYYWARCKCGNPFMVQKGVVAPELCDECDLQRGEATMSEREYCD
ncbi:MAG: hypothetical protein ACE5H4_00780 [Candidatus Thorarchaeota archaeon]